MNIEIVNKRISIDSVPYNKTLDFTKARFDHTTMHIENDAFDFAFVNNINTVTISLEINDVDLGVETFESTTDVLIRLKDCLKQVDFFFKQLGSGGATTDFDSEILDYPVNLVTFTQAATEPTNDPSETRSRHRYTWSRRGKLVTMFLRLQWKFNGMGIAEIVCELPTEMPIPRVSAEPEMQASSIISSGNGNYGNTDTVVGFCYCYIINSGNHSNAIRINHTPNAAKFYNCVFQYMTDEE